jgi:hypothetical protein
VPSRLLGSSGALSGLGDCFNAARPPGLLSLGASAVVIALQEMQAVWRAAP